MHVVFAAGYAPAAREWERELRLANSGRGLQAGPCQRPCLPLGNRRQLEIFDFSLKQPVEIEFGLEMQEDAAKPNGSTVHEYELARHGHRPLGFQGPVNLEGLASTIFRRACAVRNRPYPVIEQRAVDESRPYIQRVDQILVEALEAPGLIGVDNAVRFTVA
jgi:hypothetical protein